MQYLSGARRNNQTDIWIYGFILQNTGNAHHIHIGGIGTASDGYLIHLQTEHLADRKNIVRRMRHGDHRLQCVQINIDNGIINSILIGFQFLISILTVLFL